MAKAFGIITQWDYLKNKKYSWNYHTVSGGSFSNSGMHTSWNKCADHLRAVYGGGVKFRTFSITIDERGRDVRVFVKEKSNF